MDERKIGPNRGNAGKGRPPGASNKTTASVRAALEEAFDNLGGVKSLVEWAKSEPTEFYKLYAKLLPVQVQADMRHQGSISIIVDTGISRAPDEAMDAE
jgi:hypothetical protein